MDWWPDQRQPLSDRLALGSCMQKGAPPTRSMHLCLSAAIVMWEKRGSAFVAAPEKFDEV
jgi:hypothetical protein